MGRRYYLDTAACLAIALPTGIATALHLDSFR